MKASPQSLSYSQLGRRASEPVITDLMHRALENSELLSLAAGFTEREAIAYRTLREVLPELRRRLTPDEEAVVRPLEDRLDIPNEARLFPSRKKAKTPDVS